MDEFNYHHVLVGVDGSKAAEKAVRKAIIIAQHNQAKLTIATVINDRKMIGVSKSATLGFGNINPTNVEELKQSFEKLVSGYAKQATEQGVEVDTIIASGDPRTTLATDLPSENDYDAIVVGATGVNLVGRMIMGSTASYVVTNAKVDVFVVRTDQKDL
ncbi:universal stress protein [Lentilactobacillus sp. Marseille-Q4993]|uniref:universal stress protein n=1 Tax=Lentilactobacillus sp. Marseille-Q4993 TaxID=3039492 RepID=UPI0024BD06B7|nr:universal stress protein [Lentilactobacillus sp. Marseille-Q4993]